jgi:hypothetical protein
VLHFGDHTFYMDDAGLYIFEEIEIDDEPQPGKQVVTALRIAELVPTSDDDEVEIRPIEAALTTTAVDIGLSPCIISELRPK